MDAEEFEKNLLKAQSYCSRAEKCESDVRTYVYKQHADSEIISNGLELSKRLSISARVRKRRKLSGRSSPPELVSSS